MRKARLRTGYLSDATFGQQLASGLLGSPGEERYEHWRKICAMRVDGTPLSETAIRRRGPSPHDTRWSEKLGEALLAAHAFARLPVEDVEIDTGGASPRESPDLLATLDGHSLGIEIRELIPNAHREHASLDFHIELRDRIDAENALRPAHTYIRIMRAPGRLGGGPMPAEARNRLMNAILEYLRNGEYRERVSDEATYIHDWPGAAFGYHMWLARVRYPNGYVEFDDQRGSFDPDAMVEPALEALVKKRKRAATYDRSLPLWLVVGVTEQWGDFTRSLQTLSTKTPDIGPFERVVIHDGNTFVTYSEAMRAVNFQ